MTIDTHNTIKAIVFKEGDIFIAAAAEVDIIAQGRTKAEALGRLGVTIRAELADRNGDLFEIGPAQISL